MPDHGRIDSGRASISLETCFDPASEDIKCHAANVVVRKSCFESDCTGGCGNQLGFGVIVIVACEGLELAGVLVDAQLVVLDGTVVSVGGVELRKLQCERALVNVPLHIDSARNARLICSKCVPRSFH